MNQFAGCACYHMDPTKPDRASLDIAEKNKDVIHLIFEEGFAEDLSAENIAHFFGDFGDF